VNDRYKEPERANRRLDQWLWFARLAKSRSQAARLAVAGSVLVNGMAARKASQSVRVGDALVVPQGTRRRAVRVLDLGTRRGPAVEARSLYEERMPPPAASAPGPAWVALLLDDAGGVEDADGPQSAHPPGQWRDT
jgi:ribosome-associated heat shock protein Hsp15